MREWSDGDQARTGQAGSGEVRDTDRGLGGLVGRTRGQDRTGQDSGKRLGVMQGIGNRSGGRADRTGNREWEQGTGNREQGTTDQTGREQGTENNGPNREGT